MISQHTCKAQNEFKAFEACLILCVRHHNICPAVQQHHLICQQYHVHTPGRYCGPELRVWHTRCFVFWTTNHTPNHTTPCISLLPTLNNIVSNQSSVEQPLYLLQQPSLIRQPATDQLQHPGRLDPQVFTSAPCYRQGSIMDNASSLRSWIPNPAQAFFPSPPSLAFIVVHRYHYPGDC